MEISVTYESIDHCRKTRKFKTLKGAQAFAQKYVGKHPEMGSFYAVSGDGVGKITAHGVNLTDLFQSEAESVGCCREPMLRGGCCDNCGKWSDEVSAAYERASRHEDLAGDCDWA